MLVPLKGQRLNVEWSKMLIDENVTWKFIEVPYLLCMIFYQVPFQILLRLVTINEMSTGCFRHI